MTREEIFDYCRDNYGTEPEYLWMDTPDAAVLRHAANQKWYGVFLTVTADKLGRNSHEPLDLLDIKGDPDDIVHLREMAGFAPAYHMNKKHWLTVILPEVPDKEMVFRLIDKSYALIAPKRRKSHGIEK